MNLIAVLINMSLWNGFKREAKGRSVEMEQVYHAKACTSEEFSEGVYYYAYACVVLSRQGSEPRPRKVTGLSCLPFEI